jgi:hypothetical protein
VNAPFIDEDTLGIGHKEVHVRRKSSGHHFCDNFGNSMDEANKPKIMHLLGTIFLRNSGDVRGIDPMEVANM